MSREAKDYPDERDEQGYVKGFDYQCDTCHKVFHGPGAPASPGHIIASADHPRPLSHTKCPECKRQWLVDYYKQRRERGE